MPEAFLLKERRVHPRISIKIPLHFRIIDDRDEIKSVLELRKKEKDGRTLDASLGGLCIVTDHPIKEGSILKLEIFVPDEPVKIRGMAEVVWCNESGGGIRFLAMDETDREIMKNYLSKASTRR